MREQPEILQRAGLISGSAQRAELTELVSAIFQTVGVPVEFDELVGVVADLQEIKEHHVSSRVDEERETSEARLPDPRASVATEVEQRSYLQRLWSEILQLPQSQRLALLLNLRDAQESVIALLPLAGVGFAARNCGGVSASGRRVGPALECAAARRRDDCGAARRLAPASDQLAEGRTRTLRAADASAG